MQIDWRGRLLRSWQTTAVGLVLLVLGIMHLLGVEGLRRLSAEIAELGGLARASREAFGEVLLFTGGVLMWWRQRSACPSPGASGGDPPGPAA